MPVAAREACVYTGITIAEYFRDMGYDVALMADSTSRWAEAMREISGRLEEMPGEEGYPAYLASRLAQFYERAGRVTTLGTEDKISSVSVVGAVSPPGGDLSEPVTQNTLRISKVFWALDASLADKRHFPSIDWLQSYSLYIDSIEGWWKKSIAEDWRTVRDEAMILLQKESELQEIVQLVGPDALPDKERITLESTRMIREDFLQQNAFHEIDTYCSPSKQYQMIKTIIMFQEHATAALDRGAAPDSLTALTVKEDIGKMKYIPEAEFDEKIKEIQDLIVKQTNEV
jgi:V/A-type H+-transporting ATPase subunit A